MPSTTKESSVQISNGGPILATGEEAAVYMDGWYVQVVCTLVSGAHQLVNGQTYSIARASGSTLSNMYCDEVPGGLSGFSSFQVGGGFARFSNHKLADGRANMYRPQRWTFGQTPGASTGSGVSKLDKSKLSFSDDL